MVKLTHEISDLLAEKNSQTKQLIDKFLLDKFSKILSTTFNEQLIVWNAEYINSEILLILHDFFSNTACNIKNITLLVSTSGLETFYKDYCCLLSVPGMKIIEIPISNLPRFVEKLDKNNINKNIINHFSYYGGTYDIDPPERTFLTLLSSQFFPHSTTEMIGQCGEKNKLENWLEYKTFFCNQKLVTKYKNLYDKTIDINGEFDKKYKTDIKLTPVKREQFGSGSYQQLMDSLCLCNLTRETTNFDHFANITEKTMRCFYNHIIPIPVNGNQIIADLQKWGFWIDTKIINYDFLKEPFFDKKIQKLESSLNEFVNNFTCADLNDYYNENKQYFTHNQMLLVNFKSDILNCLKQNFL